MAKSDLQRVLDGMTAKTPDYDKYWQYYNGDAPLVYSTEKLQAIFSSVNARFSQNWAEVVVKAVLDRLSVQKPTVNKNQELSRQLSDLWENSGIWLDEISIYEDLLVTGEAFVVVWPDDEDGTTVRAFHNDSRHVHIVYDSANPRKKLFAGKWWKDDEDAENAKTHLIMYYPDRIETYESAAGDPSVDSRYDLVSSEENPFGMIPVFHFRSSQREPRSILKNVIDPQNALNKLMNDKMIVAEYMAAPQRYAITEADISGLRNAPNEIWKIPPAAPGDQPTSVGQFSPATLEGYSQSIAELASTIGVLSSTPRYYITGGDAPSGEALRVMEAPLIKRVKRLIYLCLSPVWKEIAQGILFFSGVQVALTDISAEFDTVESDQPVLDIQVQKGEREIGLPLVTVLRRHGTTEEEIEQIKEEKQIEQEENMAFAQAAISAQQGGFNAGEGE